MSDLGMFPNQKKTRLADLWPVLLGAVLVLSFFVAHQAWSTGFFTSSFGPVETAFFYSAIALGLTYPLGIPWFLARHLGHKKELVYDIIVALFWTITTIWLYVTFPFNFPQLTAVIPGPARFLLSWVTNDVGRVLIGAAVFGALAFIPFYAVQYLTLDKERRVT